MGHFSTSDYIGTRTRFQRFSDSRLFHGWIENFTLGTIVVRCATDNWVKKGDRFIFHVCSQHANARLVADFQGVDSLELIRSMNLSFQGEVNTSVIEVPEANFLFNVMSQLEYLPPTEEVRHMVGGWVVQVWSQRGAEHNAFLSDVSENGAGILCDASFQRGETVTIKIDAMMRSLEMTAEVRYSVKSKLAPDMYKTGLKLHEFGRLEGAVWRNFLKSA